MKRIYKDLKDEMYETFNFHFISPINRQKLEDLAQAALSTESVHLVQKIFDQYSNFVALEDQEMVFHFVLKTKFYTGNYPEFFKDATQSVCSLCGLF